MSEPVDESRDPLDLLAEDFLARIRRGESTTPAQFAAQHPARARELQDLLETLLLLEDAKKERESTSSSMRRLSLPKLERLGDYRIVREVGRGGMGVVFEAVQESLDRRVALKVLPQASLLGGHQLERFRREAQTAARLHHTHIVPVFDSGEAEGLHFYAMQFIDGRGLDVVVQSLRDEPAATGSQALRDRFRMAARIGAEVASALQHAHDLGTLHRDVKPANLLLDAHDHVWVTDFGLAKALQHDGLTNTGDVLGTLQYMAPEQFSGQYDARSEVYALGATLYELVALQKAFTGATRAELIDRIRAGRCERMSKLVPSVPRDLETIVARAMAIEPAARYATARDLQSDLRAFLEDRPIAARRQGNVELLWTWCRRNRALASFAAVAIVAVATAAVVGWSAYWITDAALLRAEESSQRDRANLEDTLQVCEDVFDTLVGRDPLYALLDDGDEGVAPVASLRAPIDAQGLALLERMLEFYDKFAERNRDNAALRQQTARSYARVGAIHERFGAHDEAVAAYERALGLMRSEGYEGEPREVAAVLQELGQAQVRRGRPREAASCYAQSLQQLETASPDVSKNARWLHARAHFLLATVPGIREGRPEAMRRGGAARGPGEEPFGQRRGGRGSRRGGGEPDPGRAAMAQELFVGLRQEAKKHLDAAIADLAQLLADEPQNVDYRLLRARCLVETGRFEGRQESAAAASSAKEAVQVLEQLLAEHPERDDIRFALVEAQMFGPRARPGPTSLASLEGLLVHVRVLVKNQPEQPEFEAMLARILSSLASRRHEAAAGADPRAGLAELEEALRIQRKLVKERTPREPRFVADQVQTMRRLARMQLDSGDVEAARATARELVAELVELQQQGQPGPRGEDLRDLPQLLERLGLQDALRELAERRRR